MENANNSIQKTRIFVSGRDRIIHYENNLVRLELDRGNTFDALEPRRLFPVNLPDKYITLLSPEGVEIAVIRDIADLDEGSAEVINKSLEDYYLVPQIISILSVSEKSGTIRWTVKTERGIKSFDIRNRNHDIRVSKNGVVRVRDSDDNRYIINDYKALDRKSISKLIPYL